MSGGLLAALALGAALLYYVFFWPDDTATATEKTRLAFLRERKDVVYENLRDLSFECNAGKIAAPDYQSLRASLEHEAAAILSEIERLEDQEGARA